MAELEIGKHCSHAECKQLGKKFHDFLTCLNYILSTVNLFVEYK